MRSAFYLLMLEKTIAHVLMTVIQVLTFDKLNMSEFEIQLNETLSFAQDGLSLWIILRLFSCFVEE